MQKEVKQHLIYAGIFILVITLLLLYQYNVTKDTRAILSQELESLSNQVKILQNQLNENVAQLQEQGKSLEESVSTLNQSLEEKEEAISSLTGELADVKMESEERVSELEKSLAEVKIENEDFSIVIEESVPAVVSVQTDAGSGSGFIIDAENGYIVTNYHVIERATAANIVTSDGRDHPVFIVGYNSRADVAVLRIEAEGLSRLRFGDSDDVKVGEKAIAIGNPGGLDFTVTQGIISAVDREDRKGNRYIQIDVPINPGNSGGPLIDAAGKVIGVNTLKIADFEGVGFALSSNYVDDIVDDIIG